MKAMRGIILLEVLISIMISSMIFMSLMGAVFQLSKARVTVDDAIDVHTRVTTIFDLMEQDFGGATIPVQADLPTEKTAIPTSEAQEKEQPAPEQKNTQQVPEQTTEKKEKPVTNIFYGTLTNNNIDIVSCITNNPTTAYWSERAGKAKPRIMRVVYRLIADPEHKESFLLKRQEGTELDLDAYKNPDHATVRAYEVAEGIKECKITYLYLEKQEAKQTQSSDAVSKPSEATKEAATKKEPPTKPDYKSRPHWGDTKEKDDSSTTKIPLLPSHMVVSLVMFNSTYKREYSFEFVITLPANQEQQVTQAKIRYQETPAQKPDPKKAAANPENPAPNLLQKQQKNASHESPESILVVFNAQPETDISQDNPPVLAEKSQEQLAEEMVQKNIEQFYQQLEKEGVKDNSAEPEHDNNEQIDIPEGEIDIIQDGGTTQIVYRGPITLTSDLVRGIS